ncbi:MAG: hypothetical protein EP343_04765 [Deltaproteobacteria bacterium]|nr:MAG: hypothetical protein EP343_04765 [Deltaproteobacteria bacterium]
MHDDVGGGNDDGCDDDSAEHDGSYDEPGEYVATYDGSYDVNGESYVGSCGVNGGRSDDVRNGGETNGGETNDVNDGDQPQALPFGSCQGPAPREMWIGKTSLEARYLRQAQPTKAPRQEPELESLQNTSCVWVSPQPSKNNCGL